MRWQFEARHTVAAVENGTAQAKGADLGSCRHHKVGTGNGTHLMHKRTDCCILRGTRCLHVRTSAGSTQSKCGAREQWHDDLRHLRTPARRRVSCHSRQQAAAGRAHQARIAVRGLLPRQAGRGGRCGCLRRTAISTRTDLQNDHIAADTLSTTRAQLRSVHARLYPQCYKQSPFKDCTMGRIFETRHTHARVSGQAV